MLLREVYDAVQQLIPQPYFGVIEFQHHLKEYHLEAHIKTRAFVSLAGGIMVRTARTRLNRLLNKLLQVVDEVVDDHQRSDSCHEGLILPHYPEVVLH